MQRLLPVPVQLGFECHNQTCYNSASLFYISVEINPLKAQSFPLFIVLLLRGIGSAGLEFASASWEETLEQPAMTEPLLSTGQGPRERQNHTFSVRSNLERGRMASTMPYCLCLGPQENSPAHEKADEQC